MRQIALPTLNLYCIDFFKCPSSAMWRGHANWRTAPASRTISRAAIVRVYWLRIKPPWSKPKGSIGIGADSLCWRVLACYRVAWLHARNPITQATPSPTPLRPTLLQNPASSFAGASSTARIGHQRPRPLPLRHPPAAAFLPRSIHLLFRIPTGLTAVHPSLENPTPTAIH